MQLLLRGFPSFNFFDLLREKCQPAKCRYYTGNWIINRSGYLSFRPTILRRDSGHWHVRIVVRVGRLIDAWALDAIEFEEEFHSKQVAFDKAERFAFELAHYFYPYSQTLR